MWFVTECLGLAPAFGSLLANSPVPSVMDFFESFLFVLFRFLVKLNGSI